MKYKVFKNKVVVITGAASGIGRALCIKFAAMGAKVGIMDMDEKKARALERDLRLSGAVAYAAPCNVADEKACKDAITTLIHHFGGVDILINNAGITLRDAFVNISSSAYKKVMDINFFGSLYCTQAAMKALIKRKGMIIITSSIAGFAPVPGRTGYCASKYALHGFFETLRLEISKKGVHVMMVCPTFVKTNLQERAIGGDGKITGHPQSRMGRQQSPEELAEKIMEAAAKKKQLVIPTFQGKLAWWISRLAPLLYGRIVRKQFKSELER